MKYAYKCQKCKSKGVYKPRKELPKDPHTKCSQCGQENHFKDGDLEALNSESSRNKIIKKTKSIPPQNTTSTKELAHIIESIDNPVAFASAHIFKKMIETGDVRWAQLYVSVLDKTNKLDYETIREQEWLKQAANMSMEDLVSKVAIKGFISKNILRRLEEAEDTSIYDNF